MTYFEDLTVYTYLTPDEAEPGTVNIGWLDRSHAFPKGKTSAKFRSKLEKLCQRRVNQTRGFHMCPFCTGMEWPDTPHSSAEIRLRGVGRLYAAPVLVHHYVTAHEYKPPKEFITAVLNWKPRTDSEVHNNR